MRKVYNKLIRDKIPEIIVAAGEDPKIKKLNKKEFNIELSKKVLEEAKELTIAKTKKDILSEVVDIQELLDWIIKEQKLNRSKIKKFQKEKNIKRGSFKKQLFLEYTIVKK
ncbi:MAG TPA: nucleoside triphosphate pyrophosphohydrolase [Patescibacteria group bacterium]|nr:nucleoside triphosphate pyrophosphohydrolase [Patescibacteria group bacterium]